MLIIHSSTIIIAMFYVRMGEQSFVKLLKLLPDCAKKKVRSVEDRQHSDIRWFAEVDVVGLRNRAKHRFAQTLYGV